MTECARYEPTIDEILADPTIHALMRADRVNVDRLRSKMLQHAAARDAVQPLAFRPRKPAIAVSVGAKPRRDMNWG